MCNGTRVHRGGKRGEVVVQRGTTFLDDLLDGLVLELVLVEQHADVVVPGRVKEMRAEAWQGMIVISS